MNDWFNLDIDIRNSESISIFKSRLLSLIRPVQKSAFNIFDPKMVTEDTLHYLLYCRHFSQYRLELMNNVKYLLDNYDTLPDKDKRTYFLNNRVWARNKGHTTFS